MAASFNPPPEVLRAFGQEKTDTTQRLEQDAAARGLDPRAKAGAGPINVAGRRRGERLAGQREAATERAKRERVGVMRTAGQAERAMKERSYRTQEAVHRKNSQQVAKNLVRGFAERNKRNRRDQQVANAMRSGNVRGLVRDAMRMAQEARQAPVNIQGSMYDDPEIARIARRHGDDYARRVEQLRDEQASAQNYLDVMRANQAANRQEALGQQQVMQSELQTQGQVAKYGTPEQIAETFGPNAMRDAQGNIVTQATPAQGGVDQFGRPIPQAVDPSGAFTGQPTGQPGAQQMSAQAVQAATTKPVSPAPGVQEFQAKVEMIRSLNLDPKAEQDMIERLLDIRRETPEERSAAATYKAAEQAAKSDPDAAARMIQQATRSAQSEGGPKVTEDEFWQSMVASNNRFDSVEALKAAAEKNPKLKARLEELKAKYVR